MFNSTLNNAMITKTNIEQQQCKNTGNEHTVAYTSHFPNTYDHINFCPPYFFQPDLNDALEIGAKSAYADDIGFYTNRGNSAEVLQKHVLIFHCSYDMGA